LAILFRGFWENAFAGHAETIKLNINVLMNADFGAAVGMITFGALLGKVTFNQMVFILIVETFVWAFNEALMVNYF